MTRLAGAALVSWAILWAIGRGRRKTKGPTALGVAVTLTGIGILWRRRTDTLTGLAVIIIAASVVIVGGAWWWSPRTRLVTIPLGLCITGPLLPCGTKVWP